MKNKEALRKQAADAMKAVELRSLILLEGSSSSSNSLKNSSNNNNNNNNNKLGVRGTPMAATRNGSSVSLVSSTSYGSGMGSMAASLSIPVPHGGASSVVDTGSASAPAAVVIGGGGGESTSLTAAASAGGGGSDGGGDRTATST